LLGCPIGTALDELTPIKDVTIVAGCTGRGALSLGAGVYNYIVYGFGEGSIGYGTTEEDWGSAFTVATSVPEERDPQFQVA
jgi:hypothetical protein